MMRSKLVLAAAVAAALTQAVPAYGQGYRLRIDTRYQSVAYRGFTLDSILASDAVTGPTGGLRSPDGFAVHCPVGGTSCTFFRPGPELRGGPVVSTVDGVLWGLGIPGLRFRAKARVGIDLGDTDVWPGTDPAVHLLEGYAEYAARVVTAQVGRTHVATRFGWTGFDGAKAEVRPLGRRLHVLGYGGWGLARGVALPVTSSVLDPLDDFQPRDRQQILGAGLGWSMSGFEARVVYQREIDPESDNLVSERTALDAALRPGPRITLSGGADYDIAAGLWGTADLALTYTAPRGVVQVSAGGRRYRPYFDLWTIWGAFSPVSYSAGFGSASVTPTPGLELRTRVEAYDFDDAGAATPLARVEENGWRWSLGATFARLRQWTFDAGYYVDKGPGARAFGFDGMATFRPTETLYITAHAARLKRPLEFRFNDARVWSYGLRIDYETVAGVRLHAEVRRYDETRGRDDAAQVDWNQFRINLGATLVLGSAPGDRGMHPAILRIPEGRRAR